MRRSIRLRRLARPPPPGMMPIVVQGLSAVWSDSRPGLLEHEINGDSNWHDHFHAIGSGKPTAYAVYRALGGQELRKLSERTAIMALLRILQTTINVEMAFVGEPLGSGASTRRGRHNTGTLSWTTIEKRLLGERPRIARRCSARTQRAMSLSQPEKHSISVSSERKN